MVSSVIAKPYSLSFRELCSTKSQWDRAHSSSRRSPYIPVLSPRSCCQESISSLVGPIPRYISWENIQIYMEKLCFMTVTIVSGVIYTEVVISSSLRPINQWDRLFTVSVNAGRMNMLKIQNLQISFYT